MNENKQIQGGYVNILVMPDRIRLELTPVGKGELEAMLEDNKAHDDILYAMLEDHLAGDMEYLSDADAADIGVLTSAPLLGFDVERNEAGAITAIGSLYCFPDYQILSELEALYTNGFVDFYLAQEEEER